MGGFPRLWVDCVCVFAGPDGPFATNVKDVATVLRVICGRDPLDSTSTTVPVADYCAELGKSVKGLKTGDSKEYFGEGMDTGFARRLKRGLKFIKSWDAS